MFDPWVSLLGDGSEDAAYLQALASVPRADITCLRSTEGKSTQRNQLAIESGKLRNARSLPAVPPEVLPTRLRIVLKNVTQSTQSNKTAKGRQSRAMKARARLRQQHRIRSLFVARNNSLFVARNK